MMEWDKIWAVNKKVQTDMYIYLYTVNILLVCLLLDFIGFLHGFDMPLWTWIILMLVDAYLELYMYLIKQRDIDIQRF